MNTPTPIPSLPEPKVSGHGLVYKKDGSVSVPTQEKK